MVAILVILVFGGTFLVAAVVVIAVSMFQSRSANATRSASTTDAASDIPLLLKQEESSSLPLWRRFLDQLDFTDLLKTRIEEAGMTWSVGRVTLSMLLLGSLFFAFFLNATWAPPGAAFAGGFVGGAIPYWVIGNKRKKRMAKIESQFPDALDSLSRAMRAGHALSSAVVMLATETPAPLGPEFRRLANEQRLGLPWQAALENFGKRVPIVEVRLFVAAVVVQTRTGGRLTDVLERLAETIRESAALRGEVQAISAQGRLTGRILTVLPLFIGGAMYVTNPGYINLLFQHPTGNKMVWAAGACMVAGHFVIQRIVEIKAPQ